MAVRLRLAPSLTGPAIAVAVGVALAPSCLNGVAWVHIRLPFVLALILIAGSRWEGLGPRSAIALGTVMLALVAARGATFERLSNLHNVEMQELASVLVDLPQGARLLPLQQDGDKRIWHVQAYAVVQRQAFDPTLFQGVHNLVVLPEWRSSSIAEGESVPVQLALWAQEENEAWIEHWRSTELGYLEDWPAKFDYVLLTGPVGRPARAVADRCDAVAASRTLQMTRAREA